MFKLLICSFLLWIWCFLLFQDGFLQYGTKQPEPLDMHKLLQKNVTFLSEHEFSVFKTFKENQNLKRRNNVCQEHLETFGNVIENNLFIDEKDSVAYCAIPKIGSSTWSNHFLKLGKSQ